MAIESEIIHNACIMVELEIADKDNQRACHSVTVYANGIGLHNWSFDMDSLDDARAYFEDMINQMRPE